MTVTIFTAGHRSPRGAFYPHSAAPEVAMAAHEAADLLRLLGIIDRHLHTDAGHAVIDPARLAEWLTDPVPVTYQVEVDALVCLCDFAHENAADVAWATSDRRPPEVGGMPNG